MRFIKSILLPVEVEDSFPFRQGLPVVLIVICVVMLMSGCDMVTGSQDRSETFIRPLRTDTDTDKGILVINTWTRAIIGVGDGETLLAGEVKTEAGDRDVYVARVDAQGKLVWKQTFGGEREDRAYDLIQTQSGDFVIVGIKGNYQIYLLRIDAQGDVVWENTYQREVEPAHMAEDAGFAITQTSDGGFAIVGRTAVPYFPGANSAHMGPSVLRLDPEGKKVWYKAFYNELGHGQGLAVAQTSSGDFLVSGLYSGGAPFWIDEEGTLIRSVTQDERGIVYADITALKDGSFLLTGENDRIITVTNIDESGKQIWSRTYGYGSAYSIAPTEDGGAVVAGSLLDRETGDENLYLFKIDTTGKVAWQTSRKLYEDVELFDARETSSDSIVATGRYNYSTGFVPLLLKTDAQGNIGEVAPLLRPPEEK